MSGCFCCDEWNLIFKDSSGMDLDLGSDVRPVIGGTYDYNTLENRPRINGVELIGDKTNEELLIEALSNEDIEKALNSFT